MFTFSPRWKEELVCSGPGGEFVLELTMGRLVAYLPDEAAWAQKSPPWARAHWAELRDELEQWCRANDAGFVVDATAHVW